MIVRLNKNQLKQWNYLKSNEETTKIFCLNYSEVMQNNESNHC